MELHKHEFRIVVMARVLEVSTSGYYKWRSAPPSVHSNVDVALREAIKRVDREGYRAPGAVKTWRELNRNGIVCGKHRVARLRRELGIESARKERFRVMHVHQHTEPAAPDLVKRNFHVSELNQIWVGDITSLRTGEGWLHLAMYLDLFARRVVGWAMDSMQAATLPMAALRMAITQRKPPAGLICHTDQGSVYGCHSYRRMLGDHNITPSMSRRGNCHDNAVAESFFSNLKNELTHGSNFATRADAKAAIANYIEAYYNRKRLHQTLGYRPPVEVENQHRVLNLTVH